jgi:hypothetical protein
LRPRSEPRALGWVVVAALAGCGDFPRLGDAGRCADGDRRCTGTTLEHCTQSVWDTLEACADACDPELGCVVCTPGTGTCDGSTSIACRPDGQGYFEERCDPVVGSTCDPSQGICVGPCAFSELGQSHVGCEFYPTQSAQNVNPSFSFAVAISNPTADPAQVRIEGGALTAAQTLTVAPGETAVARLPWVAALKRCMTEGAIECGPPESYGGLVAGGAYRLRSTRPVTVSQFSPFDFRIGKSYSYTNDASLLLPINAWGDRYVAPGWQAWVRAQGTMPGTMTITAHQDDTTVAVTTRAATRGGDGAPSFTPGVPETVRLDAGDVLMLMNDVGDLTGSEVTSDRAVQVIAGHYCTLVPSDVAACDHLEESVFPTQALSTAYVVAAPQLPTTGSPRHQVTRIIATRADTRVEITPPVVPPFTLAEAGDVFEIAPMVEDLHVTADAKIVVAHYMVGQHAPPQATIGDPSMTLAVPIDQYRTRYQFYSPTSFGDGTFVNLTAPAGATIRLDGAPIAADAWTAIPGTELAVARVPLSGTGDHTADSDTPFGISVYGHEQFTSFWYPGGLDLRPIPD